ncbi:hypothetical protein NHX12_023193 [Muraenolepis orangiensis]|uniref:Uncharacterized protein n=1 Tax=Muraenolepis orangiensis TaxID=630683 RepID=A0A9Q0EIS9_9TELE|nr:hypothetical protein NHX12_023193 [Muraenolepis orangiensis]
MTAVHFISGFYETTPEPIAQEAPLPASEGTTCFSLDCDGEVASERPAWRRNGLRTETLHLTWGPPPRDPPPHLGASAQRPSTSPGGLRTETLHLTWGPPHRDPPPHLGASAQRPSTSPGGLRPETLTSLGPPPSRHHPTGWLLTTSLR